MIITECNYAFIDGQNLYESLIREGWKIRYDKLRKYLRSRHRVDKIIMYLGKVQPDIFREANRAGFEVKIKQSVGYIDNDGRTAAKTNVDIDLAIGVLGEYADEYDKAVIISGDGDFVPLYRFLIRRNKLRRIIVPNREKSSTILRDPKLYVRTTYLTDAETMADLLTQ